MSNPILHNTAATDKSVLQRYLQLPQPDNKIMATYVWIDGSEENVRGMSTIESRDGKGHYQSSAFSSENTNFGR